jgi:2-polyprenyl-3-methyl-5-hydroxy-6-metoxy-1,4-benzoquinol methylase|tara:strand:+ start:2322 stop:3455 length:1134 start_codon:yes stop_codon:yes gene_type:complete
MPKKIKFESFKYRLLAAAEEYQILDYEDLTWDEFLNSLSFKYEKNKIFVESIYFKTALEPFDLQQPKFYKSKSSADSEEGSRDYKKYNEEYFNTVLTKIINNTEFPVKKIKKSINSLEEERIFHDEWAKNENVTEIDLRARNEALTAPEMRYIMSELGNLEGKTLLDVGCGLGEASVYFALKGASVTSSDLSAEMLIKTQSLAEHHGVKLKIHNASSDEIQLATNSFDIIYAGNLMHHVEIEDTVKGLKKLLKEDGLLVTWDPLTYNPAINVYRNIATEVRTPEEHPLTWSDIKIFKRNFTSVKTKYFWLTTLIIFVLMYVKQRKNPNEERFWKVVIDESDNWENVYRPLEKLDHFLLKLIPPLRLLCWNVVILSKK